MNRIILYLIILLFFNLFLFAEENQIKILESDSYYNLNDFNNINYNIKNLKNFIDESYSLNNYSFNFNSYYPNDFKIETSIKFEYFKELENYRFEKKQENLLRRSEIIFFGSLTFAAFGGWFFLSIFNVLIFDEPFGKLRQEQFVPLFVGSSLISISIVLSDLFINIKPKLKNVEIY